MSAAPAPAPYRRTPTLPDGHLEALARAERDGDLDRALDDDEAEALLRVTRRIERRH